MGIVNTTPDSFSDGGLAYSLDDALRRAERLIDEGADVLDVGGESTRPGSARVEAGEEIRRVAPVIREITRRFEVPVSVDTSKNEVARAAIEAGAEVINDISGLRFDPKVAEIAAQYSTGLVLMHSRGEFESMHKLEPVDDIFADIAEDFRRSTTLAESCGVSRENIVLDVGIGFGKSVEQNLQLISELDRLVREFPEFPMLVGTSRKSFIGKVLGDRPADQRLAGSLAAVAIAVWNGAKILRVHDVKETVDTVRVVEAVKNSSHHPSAVTRSNAFGKI